ncbi:hypothetical protein PHJA_002580500 [Phtheirospermum japonicum]|uniref:Uncharacterized protein n=1 Tax=Phtheirospermum japonicum TaxID=374723 RepID=A0A830DBC0_9LAMI|nr:hypothetical protein PHJA_002580500 [Phtheirospermum japonicum]
MDGLNKKAKRGSVNFSQFNDVDDEAKAKFKYQTLLEEHLELQKEFVSRKKKLQAAKEKKETILAEVRFLRRRLKYLSKSRVPKSDLESNALQGERNHSISEAAQQNLDHVSNINVKNDMAEGNVRVHEDDVRFTKKLKNHLIVDKSVGKQKISWPDQVSLRS